MAEPNLIIKLSFDTKPTKKEMQGLEQSVKAMGGIMQSAFGNAEKTQTKFNNSVDKSSVKVENLKNKMRDMEMGGATGRGLEIQIEEQKAKIEELKNTYNSLYAEIKKQEKLKAFGTPAEQIEAITNLQQLTEEEKQIDKELEKADKTLAKFVDKLRIAKEKAVLSPQYAKVQSDIALAEQQQEKLNDTTKKTAKNADTFGSKMKRAANIGRSFVGKFFDHMTKKSKKSSALMQNMFTRLRGVILSAFVFNIISAGLRKMTETMGQYIRLNKSFVQSLQIAKGNLLTAFQPIVSAVMPLLTILGQGLQYITGLLVQFVSLLTGQSVASMTANAKAMNGLAKATKGAGKAAKGALAPFDELNVLQQEQATGGAAEETGGAIFEPPKVDAPKWLSDLAKAFKAGDWSKIGEIIGKGLQGAFEKALSFLRDFDTQKIGENIGDFFNNVFYNLNADTVGRTIAAFWNKVVDFFYGLVYRTDWKFIGKWISNAITGFFLEFDWGKLWNTLSGIVGAGLDLIWGFFAPQAWQDKASGILTLRDIWEDVMKSFADFWAEWGEPIWEKFSTAINMIGDMLQRLWSDIISPLWESSLKPLFGILLDFLGELVVSVLDILNKAIIPLISWIQKNILPILLPIIKGIVEAVGFVSDALKGLMDFIVGVFTLDWERAWNGIKDIFKGIWNTIVTLVETAMNFIIDCLNTISIDVPDWVPGIGGKHFGFDLNHVSIPRLATGTVVPATSNEFMAILGDNNQETEVVSPLSTMKQAMMEALQEMGNTGGGDTTVILELDGRELGKAVVKTGNSENKRIGTRLVTV